MACNNLMKVLSGSASLAQKYFIDTKFKNALVTLPSGSSSLQLFTTLLLKQNINITHLSTHILPSKPNQPKRLQADFSYLASDYYLLQGIKGQLATYGIELIEKAAVQMPWFPTNITETDKIGKTLIQGEGDKSIHLAFTDPVYVKRRNQIGNISSSHKYNRPIPNVNYTVKETALWCRIYKKLSLIHSHSMSQRFLNKVRMFEKLFKIDTRIPQLGELSAQMECCTGFRIKPTHGIISQRQFLNSLAFKLFCCTQYLRHEQTPDYTPEPDIVHQILGHVPMFTDPKVAEISHKIGLLSLGATDQEVKMLGNAYFCTIQFGVEKQGDKIRAYGAGIASSIDELKKIMSPQAVFKPLNIKLYSKYNFPIDQTQPFYCYTDSFEQALQELDSFGEYIRRPISTIYNEVTKEIEYDRNIEGVSTEGQ